MKNLFILFVILFCFLSSCKQENKKNVQAEIKNISEIKLSVSDSLTVFMGLPVSMEFYKNHIFIHDFFGEEGLINVVDLEKKQSLFSFIKKGVGPNEYISVSNLDKYQENQHSILGIYDMSTNTYRKYNCDSILIKKTDITPVYTEKIELHYPIYEIFRTKKGFVATGFFPDGKFAIFNDSLNLVEYTGQYRTKQDGNISDNLHSQANIGATRLSPDRKFLINILYEAGIVEMYSINENQIKKEWEFVIYELDYKIKNGGSIQNNNIQGFINLDVTSDHIYVLYSGNNYNPEAYATYGRKIYQFDLKGNLKNIYSLDRDILDIKIKDNKIYAIAHDPEPIILVYTIN